MEREPGVLQQRIETIAVQWRGVDARKRVRGQKDEQQKGEPDHPLNREGPRAQTRRQVAAEHGYGQAVEHEDEGPQHHGAFVIAPGSGDFVDQRFVGVAVVDHVQDREIAGHVQPDQGTEGYRHQEELRERGRAIHVHPSRFAACGPDERDRCLHTRNEQRQDQRKETNFGNHPTVSAMFLSRCPSAIIRIYSRARIRANMRISRRNQHLNRRIRSDLQGHCRHDGGHVVLGRHIAR